MGSVPSCCAKSEARLHRSESELGGRSVVFSEVMNHLESPQCTFANDVSCHSPSDQLGVCNRWSVQAQSGACASNVSSSSAVSFRKGVTPGLPFRRPAQTVAALIHRAHPAAE
jgi:hypothetical protein